MSTFDLRATYLHADDGPAVTAVEVTPEFWGNIPSIFNGGRMVGIFAADVDWDTWERHPAGDEIVFVFSGAATFVLDDPAGEQRVKVCAGETVVVPTNVWHRAIVHEPYQALHITRGAGTENRPVT